MKMSKIEGQTFWVDESDEIDVDSPMGMSWEDTPRISLIEKVGELDDSGIEDEYFTRIIEAITVERTAIDVEPPEPDEEVSIPMIDPPQG